tara:strand:+ start:9665 stop:10339 length:675 start_codon:yes stop_codon:yes gene_type:complete
VVKQRKKPWPTKDAMEQIYTQHLWGGNEYDFYSGEGSYISGIINPYLNAVTSFLTSFEKPLVVCDLGCGDFNIGKELVRYTSKYIGVDIVPDLVDRNIEKYRDENLEFHCLNIAEDELPTGDCAIVRQVLQHLSNTEIQRIISKLSNYKYVILTEHLPEKDFSPNKDIISGQGTRLKKQSGVDLLVAPFFMKVKKVEKISSINLGCGKGRIETVVYECSSFIQK